MPTPSHSKLDSVLQFITDIIRIILGDPKTRIPKGLITAGIAAVMSPWWLPLAYALSGNVLGQEAIANIQAAEDEIFRSGWGLILIGVGLFVFVKRQPPPPGPHDEEAIDSLLEEFPLPRAGELNPYDLLHVARVEQVKVFAASGAIPPYIPRNVDSQLDGILEIPSFVLIAGPSRWGKTRTAYEAMKRNMSDAEVVIPRRPGGAAVLLSILKWLETAEQESPVVLWLDDIERFLDGDTIGLRHFRKLLATERIACIATLRYEEYLRLTKDTSEIGRTNRELLAFAKVIEVTPTSEEELEEARKLYPNQRFVGDIGASFTGADVLREKYVRGASVSAPGASILYAAIDWRIIGAERAIPKSLLRKAFKPYYRQLKPFTDVDDSVFEDGIDWATEPVERVFCLLKPVADDGGESAFSADDVLVDYRQQTGASIPAEMWNLAITNCAMTGSDLTSIGFRAHTLGYREEAKVAWKAGTEHNEPGAASMLGTLLAEDGEWHASAKIFRDAIALGDGEAACNLGVILQKSGDEHLAKQLFLKGKGLGDGRAAAHLGVLYYKDRDYAAAEKEFREGIKLGSAEAEHNLGILLAKRGDIGAAEDAFRRSLKMGYERAIASLGILIWRHGDRKKAVELLHEGMEQGGGVAALCLGLIHEENGETEKAEAAYQKALDSKEGLAASNLGHLLEKRNDKSLAVEVYRKGMELGDGSAASDLGMMLKDMDDYDGAKNAFRRGIDLGSGIAASNLGTLLSERGDEAGAEKAYRTGIDQGAGIAGYNLGLLLEKRGDKDGAEDAYRRGLDLGNADSGHQLAGLLHEKGDETSVEEVLRESMKLGNGEAAADLGVTLIKKGDEEGAKTAFQNGMELGCGQAAGNLGLLLDASGDSPEAMAALRKGAELGDATSAHNLGMLLLRRFRLFAAAAAFRLATELGYRRH